MALVAPRASLRDLLVELADAGTVEIDLAGGASEPGPASRGLARLGADGETHPVLLRGQPDLALLERRGARDLLAGEAEVEERLSAAVERGSIAGLLGWVPATQVAPLAARLAPRGGAVVPLENPRGVDPPTQLHPEGEAHRSFAPLVDTYATVPYRDIDPTVLAGIAYVAMFGMMFADVGQGALLLLGGLLLRLGRLPRLAGLRRIWLFVAGAGFSSMLFGLLFGEFFGPTGVVPALWLEPLEEPLTLLAAAIGVGAVLLAVAYGLGTVNRWREGGWRLALVAPTGLAGTALFLGLGLLGLGAYAGSGWLLAAGVTVALLGLTLTFVGLVAVSGGGGAGVAQAAVELFDTVIRLGTNLVSFARLAAFGLTHAALGAVVWEGTAALWSGGAVSKLAAVLLFLVGNVVTFTLEAVVAAVQALRLEYYELFSRVFTATGRAFRPWHLATTTEGPS